MVVDHDSGELGGRDRHQRIVRERTGLMLTLIERKLVIIKFKTRRYLTSMGRRTEIRIEHSEGFRMSSFFEEH